MRDAALRYASLGYRVIPLAPRGRKPLIRDWPNTASQREGVVGAWWNENPNANIGILIEGDGDLVALDIEGNKGHPISGTDAWIEVGGTVALATAFPTQQTPSGGFHVLGRKPDEIPTLGPNLRPGIEIFGGGAKQKYIIVGPSVVDADDSRGKPSGAYVWTQPLDMEPDDLPQFPAELFHGMESPRPGPSEPKPREDGGEYDQAVDAYNAQSPLALPRGSRRVDCPVCDSKGCWGRLAKRDDRWCCWSETHKREYGEIGRLTADGDAIFGDALDLRVDEVGGSRTDILRESGFLKARPPQIERYGKKPMDDADEGEKEEEPLARVWCHGMHENGYITPEEFGIACLDELPEDILFRKDGVLRTLADDGEMPALDASGMVNVMGRYVSLLDSVYKSGKWKVYIQNWAKDRVGSVVARAALGHPLVRPLIERTSVQMPIIGDDDALRFLEPGYNTPGYYLDAVDPVQPMKDADEIYKTLREIVRSFPTAAFPGEYEGNTPAASETNAIAHMLTIYTRPIIAGPTPLFVYMAPTAGTGKTTLAQSTTMAASGTDAMVGPIPKESGKFIDTVTATLAKPSSPSYIWDNVRSEEPYANGQLEALITGERWADRAKYDRESGNFLNHIVWAMTVQTGTSLNLDLSTRGVGIYLDANTDSPEDRRFDFDPIEKAKASHSRVVSALMGAVLLWDQAGRPEVPRSYGVSSRFGEWYRVVGGILHAVDPMLGGVVNANRDAFRKHAHAKDDPWTILTEVWIASYDGCRMTAGDLLRKVVEGGDLDLGPIGGNRMTLGRFLAKHEGKRVNGRKYVRTDNRGVKVHELVRVGG